MRRLRSLLRIHTGEGRLVGRTLGLMVTAWAGAAVGSSAVESLFFARFGASRLPQMFIALGLVTLPVTLGVGALLARADRRRILVLIPLGLAALMVGLRALLLVDGRWV